MNPILKQVHRSDIYAGFVPLPENLTGWGGTSAIFKEMIARVKPAVIVEVGTWLGQSAITMAEACRELGLNATAIICVDTWLGSEEHVINCQEQLACVNGYPTIYRQFLSNVVRHGVQEWIVPLPTTAFAAATVLTLLGIKPDLIYIDANHQYEAVLADLKSYAPLLNPGGVLFGHDYNFESVSRAVAHFCGETGKQHTFDDTFWIITK